ncbi:MAG: SPOR domain-containing protein [Burkholderiaceae bacterium]|nr:SPOR domain-containing protein [Burkholderiaceae bacterium]
MARRETGDADAGALDPALTQKKRARRRLLGALVLGLAAAIVLPLVLDSEPRQTIPDVQVEIPPRDTPLPPKADEATARGNEVAVVPPVEPASPAAAPEKPAPAAPAEPPKAPAIAPAAPAATAPKAADEHKPAAKAAPKPAEAPKAAPKTPEASKTAPKVAAAPKAEASAPATSASAKAETRFVVQVGAFANAGSARAQADKARKAGVRVYTETVKTAQGERTRVRVGPFTSREAADQARAKLKSLGLESSVVPL